MEIESMFVTEAGLCTSHLDGNGRRIDCSICDNTFTSNAHRLLHYVVHHELKHCSECLTIFISDDHLVRHQSRVHASNNLAAQQQQCDLCSDGVEPIAEHKQHLLVHHNILPSVDHRTSKLITKLKSDLFFCQLCALRFQFDKFVDHFTKHHSISLGVLLHWLQKPNSFAALTVSIDLGQVSCSICNQKYTPEVPKAVHQIYCAGMKYCEVCRRMFGDADTFIEHSGLCVRSSANEISNGKVICTFCGENVKFHDQNEHRATHHIAADYESAETATNKSTRCTFCPAHEDHNLPNVQSIVEHYLHYHRLNHARLLSILNSSINSQAPNTTYAEIPPAPIAAATDFDTRMVKFMYSSFEGSSSDESAENARFTFVCRVCGNKVVSKLALINHMSKSHGFTIKPAEFCCRICGRQFSSLRTLRMHRRNRHWPHGKAELCPFCDCASESRAALREHIKQHVEIAYHPCKSKLIAYNCRYCKHSSWTEDQLNDHAMNMHAEIVRGDFVLCICCAASLSSLNALRSHMRLNHPADDFVSGEQFLFQCEICKINFPLIESIRKHMTKVHPDLQASFCPVSNCVQIIANDDSLLDHQRHKHKVTNSYQCRECQQSFRTLLAVTNHHEKLHVRNVV